MQNIKYEEKPAVSLETSVRQYQQGNSEAFSKVYQASCKPLYVYAKYLEKDNDKAEDLLQDTYVEIMKSVGSLQHPEAFMTWSKTIMNRLHKKQFTGKGSLETTIADEEQAASLFDQIEDTDQTFMPAENIDEKALKEFVMDQINDLSDQQRLAMLSFYYDRLPIREIAGIMEVSENTVKAHLYQGRAAVKQKIEAYEEKHGIRMHSILPTPFLFWLFKDAGNTAAEAMDPDLAAQVFESLSAKAAVGAGAEAAASGVGVNAATATGAGAAATAAGVTTGISGKVIAIAVAGLLVLGGGGYGVHHVLQARNAEPVPAAQEESADTSSADEQEETATAPEEGEPTQETDQASAFSVADMQAAYSRYFSDAVEKMSGDSYPSITLGEVDFDADQVPEIFVYSDSHRDAGDSPLPSLTILSYKDGEILEYPVSLFEDTPEKWLDLGEGDIVWAGESAFDEEVFYNKGEQEFNLVVLYYEGRQNFNVSAEVITFKAHDGVVEEVRREADQLMTAEEYMEWNNEFMQAGTGGDKGPALFEQKLTDVQGNPTILGRVMDANSERVWVRDMYGNETIGELLSYYGIDVK